MAPRRRRTGSRPGVISPELQAALHREATRLAALGDSVQIVRAVGDFFAQLDFELEAFADVRLDAVRQLRRAGMTQQEIAEATNLSAPRVAQLCRAAGVGGRVRVHRDD